MFAPEDPILCKHCREHAVAGRWIVVTFKYMECPECGCATRVTEATKQRQESKGANR